MTRSRLCVGAALLLLVLALGGCGEEQSTEVPEPYTSAEPGESPAAVDAPKDIVDTAVAAGSFETLVAALQAAGLVEILKGEGPFTVFAPTDDAFSKLPEGTLEDLLKPENKEKLTSILTYHVVPGKVMAADVIGLESATTVNGQDVAIRSEGDTVMLDGARVVQTDIECSNGVIHVIDSVITPK
ncbi:MAG: fasciclin domain-containing protein [Armatimonadota bacterium]|nr:MAG: fasciclin domain-containing protein [Armatimonadota bacterium]